MPKPYPPEFRRDVVALARKEEAPLNQIAKVFGISKIRASPTSPKRRQALSHAVGSLVLPTITFLAAVFAQEYAGRILDNLLP